MGNRDQAKELRAQILDGMEPGSGSELDGAHSAYGSWGDEYDDPKAVPCERTSEGVEAMSLDGWSINRAHAASVAADLTLAVMTWIHTEELNESQREKCLSMGVRLSGLSVQSKRPWLEVLTGVLESPEVAIVSLEAVADTLMALGRGESVDRWQAILVSTGLRDATKILLERPDNLGERKLKLSL